MSKAKETVYLIDGSGYIFRAYYAIRPLSTRSGIPTNAVVGFAKMIARLLKDADPKLIAIAFDSREKTFRHQLYGEYKANRQQPPEDLVPQFALIYELVEAMRLRSYRLPGFEADDIIATLAQQAQAAGHEVIIVSGDKDLMQLVRPGICQFDPLKEATYDPAAVIEKFGVPPELVATVQALAGDSSDNIPGVPKVGPKSAAALVRSYGSLEAVIKGCSALAKRKAVEESVVQNQAAARLSLQLATLAVDVPIALQAEQLRYAGPDGDALQALLQRLEARGLLKDFGLTLPAEACAAPAEPQPAPAADLAQEASPAASPSVPLPDPSSYLTLSTPAHLQDYLQQAAQARSLSFDLETTDLQPARAQIVGIALAAPNLPAAYIPTGHHEASPQLPLTEVLRHLTPLLTNADLPKVGQNLKYDCVVLAQYGITVAGIQGDSMLAAYVLDPTRTSYSLDALAHQVLNYTTTTYKSLMEQLPKEQRQFAWVPIASATRYAGEDAEVALRLCQHLEQEVKAQGTLPLYEDIEIPLLSVLAKMEAAGILIDKDVLVALSAEFSERLQTLSQTIAAQVGYEINLASTKQLAELFYDKLGYPVYKKTKTARSTDAETLERLARLYPLPKLILEHRALAKLKSTYTDALLAGINPRTQRLHSHFNQTGTATGRLSSSEPNLQNIPIRTADGRRIRSAFIPQPGCQLISADYSQIELRILAHLSGDEGLISAFLHNEDIHTRTAREVLLPAHQIGSDSLAANAPASQTVTPELRRRAKAINFGIIYGLSEFGLARSLEISREEARQYIAFYFARYPGVAYFLDKVISDAKQSGYVQTLTGRRRYLPELRSRNGNLRAAAERIAKNTPIQGSAADVIKIAMIRVDKALREQKLKTRMLLQVHDELVLEAPISEVAQASALLEHEMSQALALKVPLQVSVGVGESWAAAHS